MFEEELLAGKWVHLTEIDPEEDAAVEAAWTQNPGYRLLMEYDKPRGWTAAEIKKHYETHLKDSDEHRNEFHFGITGQYQQPPGRECSPSPRWHGLTGRCCSASVLGMCATCRTGAPKPSNWPWDICLMS